LLGTTKHYKAQALTSLGAEQVFQVGSDYRARYLASGSPHQIKNISEFQYQSSQIYASAPDQGILLGTATAFLQGLYPPLGEIKPSAASTTLANGSSVSAPLTGYQYVTLHGVNDDSPETVWIKGDDNCPVLTSASADFTASAEYQSKLASTADFYRSLQPALADVADYASGGGSALSYANAYDIFDLINVARIHDNTSAAATHVTDAQMVQLRTLADSAEFGLNFNASQPQRSIHAQTFAGAVWARLNQTVSSATRDPKLTLLAGSYDTFLAFFGWANLTAVSADFTGLPDYASTMAFELFTAGEEFSKDDLRMRFLFRNGTEGKLTAFPLFGSGKADLSWDEFTSAVQDRAIMSVDGWCDACQSEAAFCSTFKLSAAENEAEERRKGSIAAIVIACVSLAGNLALLSLFVRKALRTRAERQRAGVLAAKDVDSVRSYEKESV
jgi:hypothetical protein